MPAVKKHRLLRQEKELTYSDVKDEEVNILNELQYFEKQTEFITGLAKREGWVKSIVAHHLNISPSRCNIAESAEWLKGSFNVCIPVTVQGWRGDQPKHRVLLRVPLPFKLGEAFRPGNADEKIRCEAGTYAWLQENHPDIPIPQLYGFSLSSGETFTMIGNLPLLTRLYHRTYRQILSWINRFIWSDHAILSQYVRHPIAVPPDLGYILIECIEPNRGRMLSDTWANYSNNTTLRTTLFQSLARIMLSLARVPLPKIGSFIIDNNGFILLSNRPLTLEIQQLENDEIPTDIPRDYIYSTTDSYITDIIGIHNNRLRYQPNAINNGSDFIQQATVLTATRSNIFVDKNWNITSLVDLEWGCSLPIEMIHPPYWLTGEFVDTIKEDEYKRLWTEFIQILAQEELDTKREPLLSTIMTRGWEIGTFWYSLALQNPFAIFRLFIDRIQTRLIREDIYELYEQEYGLIMASHWAFDITETMNKKVEDRREYDNKLRHTFGEPALCE
ncbi:APH domain-containing protein [Trichophyton interdigitale]|uniref:APH domain-containing protein n=1 Tax=Trichophyton interdigitale TaxID=101480 RepID=A0A9P5CX25_9EURO|nr:APH domain-containing protein [Trichophyton interdigitale]KAF3900867.1 APH domain-containing protein [Trichophyton interdigitale]KAG8211822.1 APH domain-containing protein [Trichophyton interdigitale]